MTTSKTVRGAVAWLGDDESPYAASAPLPEPPKEHDRRRGLIKLKPISGKQEPELTIDQARALIREEIVKYLAIENPTYMLVIAFPPGAGKTTEAVRQVEQWARDGRGRVLYVGQRHDAWNDLMRESTFSPEARDAWWYHWQPHTAGDPVTGEGMTCRYAKQFAQWTARGHIGFQFCRKGNVCGGNKYINNGCVWHAQKRQNQPIVFVQHMDAVLGHPFLEEVSLIVGDENPLSAFLRDWTIPVNAIIPPTVYAGEDGEQPEMAISSEAIEILNKIHTLSSVTPPPWPNKKKRIAWDGIDLLKHIGGAAHVYAVCAAEIVALEALEVPKLRGGPAGVDSVPYGHVIPLFTLLLREAEVALAGKTYATRIRVNRSGLRLLLRRRQEQLGHMVNRHLIWLDATADPSLYQVMFDREVRIVAPRVKLAGRVRQVYASLNNRRAVLGEITDDKYGKAKQDKRDGLIDQVEHIVNTQGYKRPAIVTYKAMTSAFARYETAHFGGLRGSNRMRDCDSLILIGTPQAAIDDLIDMGAMLHQERMEPFDATWMDADRRYGRLPWGYSASGFANEPALEALLRQTREAELVQAAHRVRPLFRSVDVWLLTNLPIPEFPPHELISLNDLYGAPVGIDHARWTAILALAERQGGHFTVADLATALSLSQRTARRWVEVLSITPGWIVQAQAQGKHGRPGFVIVRDF